jgi:hypothetical protein
MIDDPEAATYSRIATMAPPGEHEMMMKAMARPCHVGQLVNHHHANSAITTDIVASCDTMP